MFDTYKNIHFIGIGGSGISALAYLALAEGKQVSGSDEGSSTALDDLKTQGARIFKGHQKEHLPVNTDWVIYTEAIDQKNNPEYLAAKERGIKLTSYFQALGKLSETRKTIAVSGTHGKSTTTAMLGQALAESGLDPTVVLGTRVKAFGGRNIRVGKGPWFVVESCEYRRSFLNLKPFGLIVLNCELEHVDYYKSETDYRQAFEELIAQMPLNGFLIYNRQDENACKIAEKFKGKKAGVSLKEAEGIQLKVPGVFNQLNAAHALKAALETGAESQKILASLSHFQGSSRRMEIKGDHKGVLMIDDYGHHPTEVKATLQALKERYPERRLICVFQPHQYSRTLELLEEFSTAFSSADQVVIPDIYEARDTREDKMKMNVAKLVAKIGEHHKQVVDGKGFEGTLDWLKENTKTGDVVVTMGAGDVYKVGEAFVVSRIK